MTETNHIRLSRQAWDDLCHKCGLCCFEKHVAPNGVFTVTTIACRYLDVVSRRCRVYHKRFETGEECVKLTPELVREVNWLPEECAYREYSCRHPQLQLDDCRCSRSSKQRLDVTPPPPE